MFPDLKSRVTLLDADNGTKPARSQIAHEEEQHIGDWGSDEQTDRRAPQGSLNGCWKRKIPCYEVDAEIGVDHRRDKDEVHRASMAWREIGSSYL